MGQRGGGKEGGGDVLTSPLLVYTVMELNEKNQPSIVNVQEGENPQK